MITIERVAEIIRKYEVMVSMEHDVAKKKAMALTLNGMKEEFEAIVKENIPCPPEIEVELEKYFAQIEDMYNKTACN